MSYNITRWKTKKIDGLEISMIKACQLLRDRPILCDAEKKRYVFECSISEGFLLAGIQEGDDTIHIDEIDMWGSGSGSGWELFVNFLKHTKGSLEASLVWEGGDLIQRLKVDDGVVSREKVDL